MSNFSVVVVTFNSAQTIDTCLMSVLATLGPDDELFVVDNASGDDTAARIQSWASKDRRLKVHFSEINLGFSEGCNVGLRQATREHLVLLNPDTVVTPGWLEHLRAHFVDDAVGAVGPLATYALQNQRASTYFPIDKIVGFPIEDVAARIAETNAGKGVETKLLIGFCMMLPRRVVDKVGILDPDLFLGMDDLDLSWRLQEAGYRLIIATDAYIVHEGQVSFKTRPKAETQALVQDSIDALARKLENYYGKGRVPSIDELWGPIPWFKPSFDLWGPRSTTFRVSFEGEWNEVLRAFFKAFEPHDEVALEIRVDGAERLVAAHREVEAQEADIRAGRPGLPVSIVSADVDTPADEATVRVEPGSRAPWHLAEISPELMRQAAGFKSPARTCGLTSIIIRTLNEVWYTKECLVSICEFTAEPFELIVVDNGSTDATQAFLKNFAEQHDNVKLVFNDESHGFAGSCNQGLAVARGEFLLLLNNDVVVTEGWLSRMRRPLEENPGIGIVGPRSNRVAGGQILLDATYTSVSQLHSYARRRARMHAGQGWLAARIAGFAMLMPARLIEAIGGLDTLSGRGNSEDEDFCVRTRLADWKIWVADDAFIHRYASQAFLGEEIDNITPIGRKETLFREHLDPSQLLVPLPDPATVPLVVDNIAVEDLEDHNLLLDADWDGPAEVWLPAIEAFAAAFSAQDPVALVVAGATELALERIAAVLDARGDNAPDVLSIAAEHQGTAGLVKICQGVVPVHPGRAAEVRHLARILGKPVLESVDRKALEDWAQLERTAVAR